MQIIQIEAIDGSFHPFQSQSHRTECWMDGYIAVPGTLSQKLYGCAGYCELVIEGGILTDLIPAPLPAPAQGPPDWQEDLEAMAIDHEFRLTLLELGVI